jgi:hypothetical protein
MDEHRSWKDVNAYRAWRKALRQDEKLLDIATASSRKPYSVDIRYVAICIADEGTNGYGCFPALETVAECFSCSPRTIQTYRSKLIELGWFTVVSREGGDNRRSLVLDIAIPGGEGVITTAALPEAGSSTESASCAAAGSDPT